MTKRRVPRAFKLFRIAAQVREMVGILALALHHDEQAVLTPVELTLAEGSPTKTHVLNLLHRLVDGPSVWCAGTRRSGNRPQDIQAHGAQHAEQANTSRLPVIRLTENARAFGVSSRLPGATFPQPVR